jgi:1,4-dihydroxy-2-naphthoate octaprenyltransferase
MTASTKGQPMPMAERWWLCARPRTLTASVVPVVVALAIAPPRSLADVCIALCTLLGALLLQVAVNFANDAYDAERGVDTAERLGPPRAVQSGLLTSAQVKRGFFVVLAGAALCGVPLLVRGGVPILLVGLASMVSAWAYAGGPRPLASHGLGDVFVFAFFGVVPVCGTVWLQRLTVDTATVAASIPIGLFAVGILVVNNLRDIATDTRAGKRTLAVRLGEAGTRAQYTACIAIALAFPLLLAPLVGVGALAATLSAPLALRTVREVRERRGAALNESLAATARLQAVYGVLMAVGIALS